MRRLVRLGGDQPRHGQVRAPTTNIVDPALEADHHISLGTRIDSDRRVDADAPPGQVPVEIGERPVRGEQRGG